MRISRGGAAVSAATRHGGGAGRRVAAAGGVVAGADPESAANMWRRGERVALCDPLRAGVLS
eukprot:ctg_5280.g692